jgi:2-methylcitrate dehydratase PrpD
MIPEYRGPRGAAPASTRLARAVVATEWPRLPAAVRAQAADLFLDTLAVIAAAGARPEHRRWLDAVAAAAGECTVIGRPGGTPAEAAARANAGGTTVLQWQDGHRMARGHPASHLVPALLALAERHGFGADAVMSAFVGGYEAGTRVGIALGGMAAPLHDAGSWATIGVAAGCARLLGGDATAIAAAMDGAAALAPLPWRETAPRGATIHHLYVGAGVSTGMAAAEAALSGLTALPGTLEEFFGPRAGAAFDPAALAGGLGADGRWSHYEMLSGYLKWHPVCAHFSALADALDRLRAGVERGTGRPLRPQQVATVDISMYAAALVYDAGVPASELAARFSPAAIVYAALHPGGLHGEGLADAASGRADVGEWLARVRVTHDPALDAGYPAARPARVTLRLVDGGEFSAAGDAPYGDATNPMSATDRRAKVFAAFALALGDEGAREAVGAFDAWLEGHAPLGRLCAALRSVSRPAPPLA